MALHALQSSQNSRLDALRSRHELLSRRVKDAQQSPGINDYFISELKKEKLRLKEEIEGIRA